MERTELRKISTRSTAELPLTNHIEVAKKTSPWTTSCLLLGLYMLQVIINLDRAVIGTLAPALTDTFGTQSDVGFYISVYNLTGSVAIIFFSKLSTIWTAHGVTFTAIICFAAGSLVSGSASGSAAFILGRFVGGLGMAGAMTGVMTIVHDTVPERQISIIIGLFMTASSGATVAGPVVGGAIMDALSWRWAFYLNPLVCAFPAVILFLTMPKPTVKSTERRNIRNVLWSLDPWGNLFFAASTTCLLLYLQFGGSAYSWTDARMFVLVFVFAASLAAFTYVQHRFRDVAMIPSHLIKNREILLNIVFSALMGGLVVIASFFLPQWYQLQRGMSAKQAGISVLPMAISTAVSGVLTGAFVRAVGNHVPLMAASTSLATIGSGLLTLVDRETGTPALIGFQILLGTAVGVGLPLPHLAVRDALEKDDLGTGSAIMIFSLMLGSSIFVTLAQVLLYNGLQDALLGHFGLGEKALNDFGTTELLAMVDPSDLPSVLNEWNLAFVRVFYVSLAISAVAFLVSLAMFWVWWKSDTPLTRKGMEETCISPMVTYRRMESEQSLDHQC